MSGNSRKFVIVILVSLTLLSSCKRKKPAIPQPQSQAPTITLPPPPQPQPQPQPEPQPPASTESPTQKPANSNTSKPKPRKHHAATKPVAPPAAVDKSKTTVKDGGDVAPSGQLSAGIPQNEAMRQRESAAHLRQSTEDNLQKLVRQLSSDEQAMVQQIRTYLAQSRSADNDGDTERSYNLALKANLLSGELMKR